MAINSVNRQLPKTIDVHTFYGSTAKSSFEQIRREFIAPLCSSRRFNSVLGPTSTWKIFRKQRDVIEYVTNNNCDLMPFTYQVENGDRLFLAVHPKAFWFIDSQRFPYRRHSYEIIREFKPCKLYFDLEFDRTIHVNLDGHKLVESFINIVFLALKNYYGLCRGERDVLNLDSSSNSKFSCHLIFPNVVFVDNYHAGLFVKRLCHEIRLIENASELHLLRNTFVNPTTIEEMHVTDTKGNRKLFVDEAVYTKNRHFRLYKSSKFGKTAILTVSHRNKFVVPELPDGSKDEFIFLTSLVTYCNSVKEEPLRFECDATPTLIEYRQRVWRKPMGGKTTKSSDYVEIDQYINDLVQPGRIYRSHVFSEKKRICYDIVGNRYCGNIGREHKNNNVMFIVDLSDWTYYQKCHDPDCYGYKSSKMKLPLHESVMLNYDMKDSLLLAAVEQCEMLMQDVAAGIFEDIESEAKSSCGGDKTISFRDSFVTDKQNSNIDNDVRVALEGIDFDEFFPQSIFDTNQIESTADTCDDLFCHASQDTLMCLATKQYETTVNCVKGDSIRVEDEETCSSITDDELIGAVKKYDSVELPEESMDDILLVAATESCETFYSEKA